MVGEITSAVTTLGHKSIHGGGESVGAVVGRRRLWRAARWLTVGAGCQVADGGRRLWGRHAGRWRRAGRRLRGVAWCDGCEAFWEAHQEWIRQPRTAQLGLPAGVEPL